MGGSSIGGGGGGWGHQLGLYGLQEQALQLHSNSHPPWLCRYTASKGAGNTYWMDGLRGEGGHFKIVTHIAFGCACINIRNIL